MKTFSLPSITTQPVSNAGESDFGLSAWSQACCGKELMSVYKHLRPITLVHSPFLIYQKNSIKCLTFLESLCECVRIYGEGNSQISSLKKTVTKNKAEMPSLWHSSVKMNVQELNVLKSTG